MNDTTAVPLRCRACGRILPLGAIYYFGDSPYHSYCVPVHFHGPQAPQLTADEVRRIVREELAAWVEEAKRIAR